MGFLDCEVVTLVRDGRPSWQFRFNPSYGTLAHTTSRGTVYGILCGIDCGKPFWIGRLVPDAGWVTWEDQLQARWIDFGTLGGRYVFPRAVKLEDTDAPNQTR